MCSWKEASVLNMSIKSGWWMMTFGFIYLNFFLSTYPIIYREILKSPTIVIEVSISPSALIVVTLHIAKLYLWCIHTEDFMSFWNVLLYP